MITKRNMGKGKVRVTFTMAPIEGVERLNLVGDFNNWSIAENPMKRTDDGSWSTALTLEAGRAYQFRYLADGQTWHNDWAADSYLPNEFGADNSVVNVALEERPTAAKRAGSRKKAAA